MEDVMWKGEKKRKTSDKHNKEWSRKRRMYSKKFKRSQKR